MAKNEVFKELRFLG